MKSEITNIDKDNARIVVNFTHGSQLRLGLSGILHFAGNSYQVENESCNLYGDYSLFEQEIDYTSELDVEELSKEDYSLFEREWDTVRQQADFARQEFIEELGYKNEDALIKDYVSLYYSKKDFGYENGFDELISVNTLKEVFSNEDVKKFLKG